MVTKPSKPEYQSGTQIVRKVVAPAVFAFALMAGAPQTWIKSTDAAPVDEQASHVVVSFDAFDPADFSAAAFAD